MNTIGARVRHLRTKNNMSMEELANKIHVPTKTEMGIINKPISSGTVSNIENGKNNPSAEITIALSDFFDVSTDWILKGREHHQSANPKEESLTIKFTDDTIITIDQIRDLIEESVLEKLKEIDTRLSKNDNE